MTKSNYIDVVAKAKAAAGDGGFLLTGGTLLVEKLPVEEIKTKSNIVIVGDPSKQVNTIAGQAPNRVIVVAVGEGYANEDGNSVPLDTKVGDILIVGDHAVKWFSVFPVESYQPDTLGLCSEENTQIRFRGAAAYEAFKQGSATT